MSTTTTVVHLRSDLVIDFPSPFVACRFDVLPRINAWIMMTRSGGEKGPLGLAPATHKNRSMSAHNFMHSRCKWMEPAIDLVPCSRSLSCGCGIQRHGRQR